MVPAAVVDQTIADFLPHLEAGDILIDGGNSYYVDDIKRAKELAPKKIHYVDVGTSGGVWGLERGYCMMIGGEKGGRPAPRSYFLGAGPGNRRYIAHPGTRETRRHCRAGLPALRPQWRAAISSRWSTTASNMESWRPMRKAWVFAHGQCRQAAARARCRDNAAARPGTLSI